MNAPTLGSLFAGIGGLDLGFERAGFRTVWQVEKNAYCRRVLRRHFPHATRRVTDVRFAGARNLAPVDVICGGFPCQDISNAGLRAGITGSRSGLWSHACRIIDELRPYFALLENVAALLGRGMGRVLGDLSEIGYDAEWQVISAADVGAPHLRERIWIVAYPVCRPAQLERAVGYMDGQAGAGEGTKDQRERLRNAASSGCTDVADASGTRLSQRVVLDRVSGEEGFGDEGKASLLGCALGDSSCELQHGRRIWTEQAGRRELTDSGWWAIEPNVGRVAHGVPARVDRLRALGNAVVPQIPELIARRLFAAFSEAG